MANISSDMFRSMTMNFLESINRCPEMSGDLFK